MLREFLVREVFGRVVRALTPEGEQSPGLELRAGLAASQMVGMAMMRYVVLLPAVVEATHDELAELVGPAIQHFLAP
jgi:hypothetical protein